jgi:hypothetical protein
MGRSESSWDDGDNGGAWTDRGLMGMKEKEVGVVSDCNTQASLARAFWTHVIDDRITFLVFSLLLPGKVGKMVLEQHGY